MFEIPFKSEVKGGEKSTHTYFFLFHRYFPFKLILIISENFYNHNMQGIALKLALTSLKSFKKQSDH